MKSLLWIFLSTVIIVILGYIGAAVGGGIGFLLFIFIGSMIAGRIARARAIIGPVIGCFIAFMMFGVQDSDSSMIVITFVIALIAGLLGGVIGSRGQKKSAQQLQQTPQAAMAAQSNRMSKSSDGQMPQPLGPASNGEARFCPSCGKPLSYVDKYKAFYCYNCDTYPDIEAPQ